MVFALIAIIVSYLIGSIPTAYIFGKMLKGIDIRQYGSGNVGATNVFRTVGKIPGIAVLVLDYLKGFVVVVLLPQAVHMVTSDPIAEQSIFYISLGAAAIVGHIWTCFLGFRGGKGVATTAGVMTGLYPGIFLTGFVIWSVVFFAWKYVSLASIAAAVSLPVLAVVFRKDLTTVIFMSILCMVGTYSHRANIKRLIQGTESKIIKVKKS
jgi:acyl phosphate:glycerol-3-phosphate acyltransferase